MKPVILSALMLVCIAFGAALVPVCEQLDRRFSSPSSIVAVSNQSTATIISTMDLQRELNRLYPKLKLKVDGVYGPRTQAAHEAAVGDQYAKELMVKEIQ